MMLEESAKSSKTRDVDHTRLQGAAVAARTHVALFDGVQRRQQPPGASEHVGPVPPWLAIGKVLVWVFLVIVIEVAVGHALQPAAEHILSYGHANELPADLDILNEGEACPSLDQYVRNYVHRGLTIDELNDLRNQLCPTLAEPQLTSN